MDIAPRLDESATERETGKLREKFKNAGHNIGDALKDITRPMFEGMADEAEKWASGMARSLDHGGISEALQKVGDQAKGVTDVVAGIGDAFGADLSSVRGFGDSVSGYLDKTNKAVDSLAKALHGDVLKGANDLANALGVKLPPALQQTADKSKTLLDTFGTLKGEIKDVTTLFGDFEKDAPGIAGAFAMISDAAGPLAALLGTMAQTWPTSSVKDQIDKATGKKPQDWWTTILGPSVGSRAERGYNDLFHHGGGAPAPGAAPHPAAPPNPAGGGTGLPSMLPPIAGGAPGMPGAALPPGVPNIAPPDTGGGAHTSAATTGGTHAATFVDFTSPAGGAGDNVVPRHIGSDKGLTPTSIQMKDMVASLFPQITDIGGWRPPDGYNEHSSGQALDVMIPGWNTPQGKALGDAISQYALSTGLSDYTIWQHGQHNPNGTFQMYADRGSPTQNHMDHVHIHTRLTGSPTGGGGGFRASPAGFGPGGSIPGVIGSPAGIPGGPVAPGGGLPGAPGGGSLPIGTLPNINPTNTYGQQQPTQLGSGSGFGLTGGGLIGMAEQAASMAAGAFSFGGGSMAAQLAFQELNLAVQKGGQMAATAAMAPLETLWLSGGQMGAPSVGGPGQAGWIGKLLGGMVGSQFGLPNIAGTAQPPKQQKQPGEEADDSKLGAGLGGGDKGKQSGGQGGGGNGPAGTKDDPIHVKGTGGSSPQGAATSAASMHAYMSPMIA
ncbi:hypothetical protein [Mycobacterium sp. MFM001]|uniref:hypothetical protein n=1 Tax=Mycobacterium sp. MFM001 TaxID=2049453 RepID=UPI000E2E6BC7|nr:hypothetical protein [Mycobacterium sp. MFM001]